MDARAILEDVARAYTRLNTLSLEIISETESGDEASSNRGSLRTRAWFEAPHKIRIEQNGQNGILIVTDGTEVHSYFAHAKRYSKRPHPPEFLPGTFQPRHAVFGGPPPFLFSRLAETVSSVNLIEETPDSVELSVVYEPNPDLRIWWLSSPVRYRIDSRTNLISRIEAEVSHRIPAHDETRVRRHVISFVNAVVDEPVLAEIFQFVPPADAIEASQAGRSGGRVSIGGGGGFAGVHRGASGQRTYESHHSHEWDGEVLIERYKLRLQGVDVTFERRLTFSEDRRELRISETIAGSNGQTSHDFVLPLSQS
jgi:hypothetical protein